MNRKARRRSIAFTDALEGYWLARRSSFSKATIDDYTLTFTRFATFIGDQPLAEISAPDVQRFLDHVRTTRNLSKKSVSNLWVALSSFWTWASVELNVEHIIRNRLRQPEYRAPVIQIYTEVEIKAMLRACEETNTWQSTRCRPTFASTPSWPRSTCRRRSSARRWPTTGGCKPGRPEPPVGPAH